MDAQVTGSSSSTFQDSNSPEIRKLQTSRIMSSEKKTQVPRTTAPWCRIQSQIQIQVFVVTTKITGLTWYSVYTTGTHWLRSDLGIKDMNQCNQSETWMLTHWQYGLMRCFSFTVISCCFSPAPLSLDLIRDQIQDLICAEELKIETYLVISSRGLNFRTSFGFFWLWNNLWWGCFKTSCSQVGGWLHLDQKVGLTSPGS